MPRPVGRAFTLMELLLVIAIISVLIALVIQTGGPIREAAKLAQCQGQLRGLYTAYMSYVTDFGRGHFPPVWATGEYNNGAYAGWYCPQNSYQIVISGRMDSGFGPLLWHNIITNNEVFLCPAVNDSGFEWWHDSPITDDEFWSYNFVNPDPITVRQERDKTGTVPKVSTRSCYSIRPYLYPWGFGQLASQGKSAIMADNPPVPECVLERHHTGVNVAYLDGSVEFVEDELLWNNELDWNYMALDPRCEEVWKVLENAKR